MKLSKTFSFQQDSSAFQSQTIKSRNNHLECGERNGIPTLWTNQVLL